MNALGKAWLGLHAWGGMLFSWLLVPIFVAGSLAVFEPEIGHWMRPEIDVGRISPSAAADLAELRLQVVGQAAPMWRVRLPGPREAGVGVSWGAQPRQLKDELLDADGRPVPVRATHGGHFFTDFHAELMLGKSGRWIVGAIGIVMLAAIVSGIFIHHRILRDFFTFRPRANRRRAWLDAHNLIGVATLPFLLLITYSGVMMLADTFMPAATQVLYDGKPGGARADAVQAFQRKASGDPATMLPLREHLAAAERILGVGKVTSLTVRLAGDRHAFVQAHRTVDDRLGAVADHVTFDAVSGALLGQQLSWNPMTYAYRAQVGLHVARFGGPVVRWVYFISGLLGAAMMAAGTLVFLRKRRQRHANGTVSRVLEGFGCASVAGILLACLAYLGSNRLLPAALPSRDAWEVAAFFAAWALSLGHGLWRGFPAWRGQLLLAGLLALLLPVLDLATGGGDALRLVLDLTGLVCGGLLLLAATRFFRKELS